MNATLISRSDLEVSGRMERAIGNEVSGGGKYITITYPKTGGGEDGILICLARSHLLSLYFSYQPFRQSQRAFIPPSNRTWSGML